MTETMVVSGEPLTLRAKDGPRPLRSIAAIVLVVSSSVILGWLGQIELLMTVIPGAAAMKFNTALIFLLISSALLMSLSGDRLPMSIRTARRAIAFAALTLSAATLLQFPTGLDLHVDQLFFSDRGTPPLDTTPGRMNLFTAISLVMLSIALVGRDRETSRQGRWPVIAALSAGVLGLAVLFGYLYGVEYFFVRQVVSPMAIHTAVLILLLSIAIAGSHREGSWLAVAWRGDTDAARTVRLVLPTTLFALTAFGLVRLAGERQGLFDLEIGISLHSTIVAVAFVVVVIWMGNRMDATERRLQSVILHASQSEERFRLAAAATNDPIFEVDLRTGEMELSKSIFTHTGWSPDELNDTASWLTRVHPEDREPLLHRFEESLETNDSVTAEYRFRRKDGSWAHLLSRRLVLRDESTDEPIRVIGSIADVTRQRELRAELERMNDELETRVAERTAELRQAVEDLRVENDRRRTVETILVDRTRELEKTTSALTTSNRELEAFAYSVSHDLRAPLRSLDGFSRILIENCESELDEENRDYLQRVRAAAQKMGRLIEAMLKLSRVSRADMSVRQLDLSAIASKIIADLEREEPGRNLDVSVAGDLSAIGDPVLVEQILRNLIENAWKFTSKTDSPRIEVGSLEESSETVYFVRDNGAGFDMKYADKLFGAFQRLHKEEEFHGTGIGLTTVQRIVNRHGGRIWADAAEGSGATFYFTLTSRD